MKRILLVAPLLLALTGAVAIAQTANPPDSSPGPTNKGHYGHHHHPSPQQQAAFLTKKLNLSADQEAKLEPVFADQDQKMKALWSDTSLSQDQKKEQFHAIHQSTKQQLESILTPDQIQQMKSLHGHHNGHWHGQSQTAPPSGL